MSLFLTLIAYLIGSISSAILISRLKGLEDPRKVGSGNPGATNVLRSGNKSAAALTLLGDIVKGFVPTFAVKMLWASPWIISAVGLAALLGHLYPLYYGFKGGKGVATSAGVLLAISPISIVFLVPLWLGVAFITKYSSLAALIASAAAPILIAIYTHRLPYILLSLIVLALLIWRHRENIKRLIDGTEGKISFSKSTP